MVRMDRGRFVQLGVIAFGLILASFLVRGISGLILPRTVAIALAAPIIFVAAAIFLYLFAWGLLDITGIRSVE